MARDQIAAYISGHQLLEFADIKEEALVLTKPDNDDLADLGSDQKIKEQSQELAEVSASKMNHLNSALTALSKKQNTIVFSFRSQDKFIKRAAKEKGWV